MCMRVDAIGRKLTQANPGSGVRPGFAIHGSPKVEVFHQGTTMVHITQPLVQKCKSEAELAAVIALELGKMVSEREALAHPRTRSPERTVPADVPIGNSGQVAALDQVRLAELARFEQEKKAAGKPLPPPDPHKLAAIYLEKAGYSKTSLDAVRPLLDEAEANYILEKQFKNAGLLGHVPPRTP